MVDHPEWASSLDPRHWADVINQRNNALKPVSNSFNEFYRSMPEEVKKRILINQRIKTVHDQFSQVVDPFILEHTNSVYLLRHKDLLNNEVLDKVFDLVVYVDNSLVAAELNARRELICLKYREQFNIIIDVFEIRISRGIYKEKHPFQQISENQMSNKQPRELSEDEVQYINDLVQDIPEGKMRNSFIKAIAAQKRFSDRNM